jgi:Protein of unknown function (DUF2795)
MQTNPVEVQKFLKNIEYPVKKNDLIQQTKKYGASREELAVLEKLPDKEYTNSADINKELKGK